jgi:signal transduction histidine kinase
MSRPNSLERIYISSLKFLGHLSFEQTLKVICEEARGLVGADYATAFLGKADNFHRVFSTVPKKSQIKPRNRGFTYQAFKTGKPFIVNKRLLAKLYPQAVERGINSFILIPLSYKGFTTGVLSLETRKHRTFNKSDLHTLQLFGSMASLAIRKVQLSEELADAINTRDLFIALASHELKTPMSTILGFAEWVNKSVSNNKMPDKRWTQLLHYETIRLSKLVNELLEVNLIRTGQLDYHMKKIHLKATLERALANFRFSHNNREVVFDDKTNGKEDIITADFDKLVEVFINLLSNAAKFSEDKSEIKVVIERKKSNFVISVIDKGIGINPKEMPKIFHGFYKGKHKNIKGMGLGLFITKEIVEKHKGSLDVRSKLNEGTTVTIFLPSKL